MSSKEVRAYLTRWQLVREAEVAELRRTPLEVKLKQLEALMASRDVFSSEPNRDVQIDEARERWARVRRALSA